MSNRSYICPTCGIIRRASAMYYNPRKESIDQVILSARWPKHCGHPMAAMSFVQTEGATQLRPAERVAWVASGMHVVKHRGKHKWKPATSRSKIAEAVQEVTRFQAGRKSRMKAVRK